MQPRRSRPGGRPGSFAASCAGSAPKEVGCWAWPHPDSAATAPAGISH